MLIFCQELCPGHDSDFDMGFSRCTGVARWEVELYDGGLAEKGIEGPLRYVCTPCLFRMLVFQRVAIVRASPFKPDEEMRQSLHKQFWGEDAGEVSRYVGWKVGASK